MLIKETDARNLLTDMGNDRAAKCNAKALEAKLNELPTMMDVLTEPKDEVNKKSLKTVLKAFGEGESVVVEEERIETTNGKPHKPEKSDGNAEIAAPKIPRCNPKGLRGPKPAQGAPKTPSKAPEVKEGKKTPLNGQKQAKKDEGAPKPHRSVRKLVMEKYSTGPFVRWLGRKGVEFDEACKILDKTTKGGRSLSDLSVKLELREIREDHPPAKVAKEDAEALKTKFPEVFAKKGK